VEEQSVKEIMKICASFHITLDIISKSGSDYSATLEYISATV